MIKLKMNKNVKISKQENKAEQMINEIDKALAEQGDKIDATQKESAEKLKDE